MTSMQQRIDALDWTTTPIGPRESWPQSLRTSLSICLASKFPILIWWGRDLIKLYNDAYVPMLGAKHPDALGARGRDVWPEIWPIIGPMLDQVMNEGKATWSDDQLLMLDRHGYHEETYFTFSYSPILDESGGVGGIFTAVFETTSRVIGERRLETLRRLAARTTVARSVEGACRHAIEILETNPHDVPFAAIYVRRPDHRAECIAATGRAPSAPPQEFAWHEPPDLWPDRAITLPLNVPGEEDTTGLLVAGISPHRALDDDYRAFFSLISGHIATVIADAKAYETERARAEALAELDRAKTAFFSNVSHEFRTPLTLLLGPVEDLLAMRDLPITARESLEVAHRNATRLLKLVNTLLDFSRIEAGRTDACFEPANLSALTSDLASVFRSTIESAGMKLVVDCPPLDEPVYIDRELWEKIVLNLLSNAFKFTFEGTIEVALRQNGPNAELSVRDTGTGIPADELPHLFERFHRVRDARGRTLEGSGIGLALVHQLVESHGGTIRVESEVDRGTIFTVSIPFGRAHLPPDRIGAARTPSTTVRTDAYGVEAGRWLPEPAGHPAVRKEEGIRRARIVLADDNADMREYARRLLASSYDVEAVSDGVAALEAARRETPDLVLTDVMMPRMDGFALMRALRDDLHTREIPVILLSARAGEDSRVEGLHAGADDYLIKPFSAPELLARVEAHVRMQRIRRDAERALRESEAKFETAFSRSPLALTITSLADGRLVDVNEGFVRLSGHSREESIGRTPGELGLWVEPEKRAARFARLRAGDAVPDIEARFRIRNGTERIGFVSSALVEINGAPCVLSCVVDITERRQAEDAVRRNEARFHEFADTAPAMLWITEPDGRCSFFSRSWYEFTGQSESEALGLGWLAALHPDDLRLVRDTFLEANVAHEPFAIDFRVRNAAGEYRWVIGSGRPRFGAGIFLGFVGSVIDITDRKRAEQAKDEFLATLSHELRTPLTSGFGWVKLLAKTREPEILSTGLAAIEESLVNQMKLIDDLLDVSRIAAGKLHLDMHPVDAGSIVEDAIAMVRPSADAKEIELHVHASDVLSILGDASRLKQVFWNLLSNAIKFTPSPGVVDVELKRREGWAEVVVRDRGEGIDAKFLPHVFDRFRQADASTTRRHGGLGIGLSIVASLVESHGGSVRAESEGLGRGATFTVTLPLIERAVTAPAQVSVPRERPHLHGARIVVVDDDPAARRVMIAALETAGAEVRGCATVADAYDTVLTWSPDILVSDLAMPNEDGYSLIRRLRESGSALPALAITAYVRPEDEARVWEAGFQQHVPKPFDPDELVRAVRALRSA